MRDTARHTPRLRLRPAPPAALVCIGHPSLSAMPESRAPQSAWLPSRCRHTPTPSIAKCARKGAVPVCRHGVPDRGCRRACRRACRVGVVWGRCRGRLRPHVQARAGRARQSFETQMRHKRRPGFSRQRRSVMIPFIHRVCPRTGPRTAPGGSSRGVPVAYYSIFSRLLY